MLTAIALLLAGGCGGEGAAGATSTAPHDTAHHSGHDSGGHADESTTSKSTHQIPPIVQECKDHPLSAPANPGEPFCHSLFVLELVNVQYDVPESEAKEHWPAKSPDDPVWMLIDFKATSIAGPPPLMTDQVLPGLTDVSGQIQRVGAVVGKPEQISPYESLEFQGVYVFDRPNADRSTIVLCADFLSSAAKSAGCTHI